jgi:outer membrane lipoprotein-sorting protein
MRWLLAATVLVLAAPIYGQDKDAEKLYRAMEKKVREAKSIKVLWEAELQNQPGESGKVKGSTHLADGNKARIEFAGSLKGTDGKLLLVSDGKQTVTQGTLMSPPGEPGPPPQPTRANFYKTLAALTARGGMLLPVFVSVGAKDDDSDEIDKVLPLSAFKLGGKEKIGKVDAQIIEYTIAFDGKDKAKVKLWLDAKTMFPVKRHMAPEGKEGTFLAEAYSEFVLDPKLDAKLFELPK